MKKVAIVTIESFNYGNRLQNYALQEVIRSLGYDVKTLHRVKHTYNFKALVQDLLQTKGAKFRSFDKNIDFSDIAIKANDYPLGLAKKFDYFIAGSDQVWNPYYDFVGACDLLCFAKANQRISYAASFGVDFIPDDKKEIYINNLKEFKALSVRETSGANIIKELIGKDVEVVLDPTMLISRDQWIKMEKEYKITKPYVLVYALNNKSDDFDNAIKYYQNEYDIFDIRTIKNNKEIAIGPSEFLYLIHHAQMILTDSFHAAVFSLIYHKKFMVFKRSDMDMSSRIVSLANIIGANDKLVNNNLDCSDGLDYEFVDKLFAREKEKSLNYLKKALEA